MCRKSGLILLSAQPSKGEKDLCKAFTDIISTYAQYGHKVKRITTDDENTFQSVKGYLARLAIELTATSPYQSNKRAERAIRSLKTCQRAMLAQLPYELPPELTIESYMEVANNLNRVACKASQQFTPYQLLTGAKPKIPQYYFGQTGVFSTRRRDEPQLRGEWGILVRELQRERSYRVYILMRKSIYIKRKFVAHDAYPSEWNLLRRIRPKAAQAAPVADILPSPPLNPNQQVIAAAQRRSTSEGATSIADVQPLREGVKPYLNAPVNPVTSHREGEIAIAPPQPPKTIPSAQDAHRAVLS
jgi:hypothetical protein